MKNLILTTILTCFMTGSIQAQHDQNQNHSHTQHLETLLTEYMDVKEALVNDNFEDAKSSLHSFSEEVTSNSEMNHHPEHNQMHETHHSAMLSAVETASNAENIDQFRNSFDEISAELIKAVKNQNVDADLYIQFCPMADDGNGARWLSKKKKIKNPYYGEQMHNCGETVETL